MGPTVLLVEDDEACAAALLRVLGRLGVAVERVGTGLAALHRLAAGGVDLVVLDLGLPDLDGHDVCRVARVGGYAGGVLVLTARHGDAERTRALAAGADVFMNKPFLVSDLVGRVRDLLGDGTVTSARTSRACPTRRA